MFHFQQAVHSCVVCIDEWYLCNGRADIRSSPLAQEQSLCYKRVEELCGMVWYQSYSFLTNPWYILTEKNNRKEHRDKISCIRHYNEVVGLPYSVERYSSLLDNRLFVV